MAKKKKGNKKNKSADADGRATEEPLVQTAILDDSSSNPASVYETCSNVDAEEPPQADTANAEPKVLDATPGEVQSAEIDTANEELTNITTDIDTPANPTTLDSSDKSPTIIHSDEKSKNDQLSVNELTDLPVSTKHVEDETQEVHTTHEALGDAKNDNVEKPLIETDNTCVATNSKFMLSQMDEANKMEGGDSGTGPEGESLSTDQPTTKKSAEDENSRISSIPECSIKKGTISEKSSPCTDRNTQIDTDSALSIREKLIQKDCQEWTVNAENSEENTSVGENGDTIDENKPDLKSNNTLESENIDDDSIKRKSSVEMEDVDLEDESTGNGVNITPAAKQAFKFLVGELRDKLGDDATNNVPDEVLRQYICWKPDLNRAIERYKAHDKFLKDNFSEKTLLLSVNPKVCYLLRNGMALAPEELIDKSGSAVMVIRPAKCDFSPKHGCSEIEASRAIFFMIQLMLERKSMDTSTEGIVIVLDLVGCQRKHISGKLIKILGNAAGCFPIRIKAIYVVGMPWWFPSSSRKLFSPKLQERIFILKEKAALSEYIDKDRLLEEDGGIYNFDLHSWIAAILSAEVGMKR